MTFDFPWQWKKGFFRFCWFFSFPKGYFLHNPKLTLHSQKVFFSHTSRNFYKRSVSPTLPRPRFADKSPNHSDARRCTLIQSFSSTVTTVTHTQVWTLSYVVSSLYAFFIIFFYAYGFYWLAVMASSSASVFVVNRLLFWGFDDDHRHHRRRVFHGVHHPSSLCHQTSFSCVLFFIILKLILFFSLLYYEAFCVLYLWKYN